LKKEKCSTAWQAKEVQVWGFFGIVLKATEEAFPSQCDCVSSMKSAESNSMFHTELPISAGE